MFDYALTELYNFLHFTECTNDWSIALDNRNSVDISYIDFSRAFDSVVHTKLLCKLVSYGIIGTIYLYG